jgi:hypothetical protein
MAGRLFHAIVLVGTAMGCSSGGGEPASTTDAKADVPVDTTAKDEGTDTFATIMPMKADSDIDTFDARDTATTDTFPGIMPPPADTFPGI